MAFWGIWRRDARNVTWQDLIPSGRVDAAVNHMRVEFPGPGVALALDPRADAATRRTALACLPDGTWLLSSARIDNRAVLCARFGLPDNPATSDAALVQQAWLLWGEQCGAHLLGDWSFALWQPARQRMLLVRDQLGISSLYYYADRDCLAFATQSKLLPVSGQTFAKMNDLYLAHLLLSWQVSFGASTAHAEIRRVPPAHTLAYDGIPRLACYWEMLDAVKAQPVHSVEEAAAGALAHFDEAVRCRIRPGETIASALSGGLDSSAVTLTAAAAVQDDRRTIHAYTAAPLTDRPLDGATWFGDEWPLASVAAEKAPNLVHLPVRSPTTPLAGIRKALWIHDGPVHAAGNAFWLHDLLHMAHSDGCQVQLTGQMGNLGISWSGPDIPGGIVLVQQWLRAVAPAGLKRTARRRRINRRIARSEENALSPEFARRINVLDVLNDHPRHPLHDREYRGIELRVLQLGAGRSIMGCILAEQGSAFGVEIRDPTADIRLLTYCLGVPPHLFVDASTSMNRMLMRTAMAGRLPDAVRLNRRRGLQSADIIYRLRADRDAMAACLDELARGDAGNYVNLPAMRSVWQQVLVRADRATDLAAKAVLLRGIMVGLFVQNPAGGPRPKAERAPQFDDRGSP